MAGSQTHDWLTDGNLNTNCRTSCRYRYKETLDHREMSLSPGVEKPALGVVLTLGVVEGRRPKQGEDLFGNSGPHQNARIKVREILL
jgi:hypothetical protein